MSRPFTKRFDQPRLSPEQAARQGRASKCAIDALGGTAAVIAFLNTHDETLGGRPLDIATSSDQGLHDVMRALQAKSA